MDPEFSDAEITLAHGAGGSAMRDLIEQLLLPAFDNPILSTLEDQAKISMQGLLGQGDRLAMTTDSYVVDPLFFPGGDIGKLAITGTVNDLAVGGAKPLFLTCGLVIEEGFSVAELKRVLKSMRKTATEAGIQIVTGDTKVVNRGAVDKLFINTAGVGVIPHQINLSASNIKPGDKILINGYLGDHGAAIVDARGELSLETRVESDCAVLSGLISEMLAVCPEIRAMRDATRGGLASVLNEFAQSSQVRIQIDETCLPIRNEVRGVCELLGLDPLYLANEGKVVAAVPEESVDEVLEVMRVHPAGRESAMIGEVSDQSPRLELRTAFGGSRILDLLVGEQLPRIC